MEQFDNVDQLLASLNRLVEEDVEPTPSREDRIGNIEQSIQAIALSVDEVNQRAKQVVELCCSQGQLFAKIYHRSEAVHKETESQLRDIKRQITHLSSQLQALVQVGSYGGAGAGIHAAHRPLNSFQLSPVSAGASRSPITSSAFAPAITAHQTQTPSSLPYLTGQRSADAVVQHNFVAHDGTLGMSAVPMVTVARSGQSMPQSDLSLQTHHQQFQLLKQQQPQLSLLGLSEPSKHLDNSLPLPKPQAASQDSSAQEAALAFFQKHNQRLPGPETPTHDSVSDGSAALISPSLSVSNSAIPQLTSDNTQNAHQQQNVASAHLSKLRPSPTDKPCLESTPTPALVEQVPNPVPEVAAKSVLTANRPTFEDMSKSTKPSCNPTTTSKSAASPSGSNGHSASLAGSSSSTTHRNKLQPTRNELDTSKHSLPSRSYNRTLHRSRSPPARRSRSRAESQHSPSHTDYSHSTASRDLSPPRMKVTIKGATKHYRDSDSTPERSSNKRRNTSPRVTSNSISFLSDSGSDSGLDIDDLIERRFSNTESGSRRNGKSGMDIGIVGASSSTRGSGRSASKGEIAIKSRPRSQSPARSRHERGAGYDHGDANNAGYVSGDRYVPGSSSHISNRLSDSRDINSRLNVASPRSATIIPLRDCNGELMTPERISHMMGPFVFIGTPMISPLYRMFYGCQALTTGVSPHGLNRAITGLNGFTFWATNNPHSDGVSYKSLAFVRRDGVELDRLQRRMSARLLGGKFVLEPLLCYFVATLAMVKVSLLTGDVVRAMFKFVMHRPLETLSIVTKDGIKRMSADSIADMTVSWLVSLVDYIHHNSRATESLDMADRCYQTYMTQCRNGDSDSNNIDPSGEVAKGMLTTNRENSRLFLGIRSSELQKLYKYLVQMMPGSVPVVALTYLRHVSESYIDRD